MPNLAPSIWEISWIYSITGYRTKSISWTKYNYHTWDGLWPTCRSWPKSEISSGLMIERGSCLEVVWWWERLWNFRIWMVRCCCISSPLVVVCTHPAQFLWGRAHISLILQPYQIISHHKVLGQFWPWLGIGSGAKNLLQLQWRMGHCGGVGSRGRFALFMCCNLRESNEQTWF